MASQQSGPPTMVIPVPQWRKPESLWGNILEFFLTYGFGLTFAAVNLFLVFGPFEFETDAEKAAFFPYYNKFVYLYLTSQFVAAFIGVQARFTTEAFRLFSDTGASLANLLVPVGAILLGGVAKTYVPSGVDMDIIIDSTWVMLLDVIGIGFLQWVALQRVDDIHAERR